MMEDRCGVLRITGSLAQLIWPGLCALCMTMSACTRTTIPDLRPDVPSKWQHEGPASDEPLPVLDTWWKAFNDSMLDQLIAEAQRDNLTVQMAAEKLKAARHLHHRARADFWPNLNFRVYEETAPGGQTGYLEMGFDTTWELGLFGRSEANARVSVADVNTAAIDFSAARITISAEVARDYVDLCAARGRARIAEEIAELRRQQHELAQTRLRLHLISRSDADRASAEWLAAQSDAVDATIPIAEAEAGLSVLLGRRLTAADLSGATNVPAPVEPIAPQPPANLVRTRPEIRRAEQSVVRAAGELGVSRADLYPKFSIVGTLISSTALTGDLDSPNKAVPLLGPAITLPIVDWNARRAVVSAREAALSAAILAYREAILEGVAEVEAALARSNAKTALLQHAESAVHVSLRAYDTAASARKIGLIDDMELASAKLAVLQAQAQQLQVQRDRTLSFIALYKAFGGNMPPLVTPP